MKKLLSHLFLTALVSVSILTQTAVSQTVVFSEDFESGKASSQWKTYYNGEDSVIAVPIAQAPKPLTGGGKYVGRLQDINGSYSGSAVAVAGSLGLQNYSIEADVYVYVKVDSTSANYNLSAYTGLVVYADSSKKDFYKLRADFDVSDRLNFSGLKADPNTFLPLFSKDYKGSNNPGLFPTVDGWHKLKIEVRNTSATQTSFWNYLDGTLLNVSPIVDTTSGRNTAGQFGLYSFQQDSNGIAAYFDNIVVKTLPTSGVNDKLSSNIPDGFALGQNYPNPFNPTTAISYQLTTTNYVSLAIFDQLGREVKTLVSQSQSPGQYSVNWDGKNQIGKDVSSGVYFYKLQAGNNIQSKKMILMK